MGRVMLLFHFNSLNIRSKFEHDPGAILEPGTKGSSNHNNIYL